MKNFFQKGWKLMKLKLKNWKKKLDEKTLYIKQIKKYDFQQYETIRSFGDSIYDDKISIDEVDIDQSSLLNGLKDFNDRARPKAAEDKYKKKKYKSGYVLYEGR